jgi:hypothetical protein
MNRVYLNGEEITSFETNEETISFVNSLISGRDKVEFGVNCDSVIEYELIGGGCFEVSSSEFERGELIF